MASNVFVIDSSFKRTQVKVTPGRYLREILEEACRLRKLNPEGYTLKNQNNKTLDLSQPFRLSGLSPGAKLQLTQVSRSPSVVSVAIQLPESEGGGRISDKFPSTTSLWMILRKCEDGVAGSAQKLNLTQRGTPSNESGAGRLLYEQPCVNLMGRSLESFTDMQKTLAQLGLNSGNIMMRLSFKPIEQPLEEAMQEISQYFESVDTVPAGIGSSASQGPSGAHAGADGAQQSTPFATADNSAATTKDEAGPEATNDIHSTTGLTAPIVQNDVLASSSETPLPKPSPSTISTSPTNTVNGISVFLPPTSSTPAAALAPDDPTVFEPTIDHAKAHQAALTRAGRNTRLLSDKELDEAVTQQRSQLALIQEITVRVRYPDQSLTEFPMPASATGTELYTKVGSTLRAYTDDEPFELRYLGSKGHTAVPDSDTRRLVRDLGLRGRVLVTLVWGDAASAQARQAPSLKEEYRARATELKVELASAQPDAAVGAGGRSPGPESGTSEVAAVKGRGGGDVEGKLKKFLGFGKK